MQRKTHTIDATDKVLGRLATGIAVLLRGKNKPEFAPHKDIGDFVVVKNVRGIKFTGRKLLQKKYFRHTAGYLGKYKETPMGKLFAERPEEVLRKAVLGMLPKNRLRAKQIKRLKME